MIIDDAYNASPLSVQEALFALRDLRGGRKVAIIGDMRELGKYGIPAHEAVGRLAAKTVDVLVTVGPLAKFIAESAQKSGLSKRHIQSFETADEARNSVQTLVKSNDLVLVKGSRALRLEIIVEALKAA